MKRTEKMDDDITRLDQRVIDMIITEISKNKPRSCYCRKIWENEKKVSYVYNEIERTDGYTPNLCCCTRMEDKENKVSYYKIDLCSCRKIQDNIDKEEREERVLM